MRLTIATGGSLGLSLRATAVRPAGVDG